LFAFFHRQTLGHRGAAFTLDDEGEVVPDPLDGLPKLLRLHTSGGSHPGCGGGEVDAGGVHPRLLAEDALDPQRASRARHALYVEGEVLLASLVQRTTS
jgi:hypothetical protein